MLSYLTVFVYLGSNFQLYVVFHLSWTPLAFNFHTCGDFSCLFLQSSSVFLRFTVFTMVILRFKHNLVLTQNPHNLSCDVLLNLYVIIHRCDLSGSKTYFWAFHPYLSLSLKRAWGNLTHYVYIERAYLASGISMGESGVDALSFIVPPYENELKINYIWFERETNCKQE